MRSPAWACTAVTNPGTGRLIAMFSLFASTSPTAPIWFGNAVAGGGDGGASEGRTGVIFTTDAVAKTSATTARMGSPYLIIALFLLLTFCEFVIKTKLFAKALVED